MLRLSKLTDYAIVLLGQFVHGREQTWTARVLADRSHLPLPTVSKVLKTLARAGLLVSERGATGGYLLARPGSAITVAEVISAIDGPIAITECVTSTCGLETSCPSRHHWHRINGAVAHALHGLTIHEMTKPAGEGQQLVHLGSGVRREL